MTEPKPDFEQEYADFEAQMTSIPDDVQAFIDAGAPMVIDRQETGESDEDYATRKAAKQEEHEKKQERERSERIEQEEKAKQRQIRQSEREWENETEQDKFRSTKAFDLDF